MSRVVAAAAVLLYTVGTVTACGGDSTGGSDGGGPTETIEITVSGDTVTPSGKRIEVEVNQPVALVVTADAPGEIHVHSEPEQEFSYSAGTETFELQIDKPGVVEVESHTLEKIIVQLEVS